MPRRVPWCTGALVLLAVAVQLWPAAHPTLALQRDSLLAGEWWRLWTAHLTHFGASHFGWNIAVIAPAGAWAERLAPMRTRLFYGFAPVIVSACLLAFDPVMRFYAGASALATGVVALLAINGLARTTRRDRWFWCAVLVLLAVKITWEFHQRAAAFVRFAETDVVPVPLAHLVGVGCGAAACLLREKDETKRR